MARGVRAHPDLYKCVSILRSHSESMHLARINIAMLPRRFLALKRHHATLMENDAKGNRCRITARRSVAVPPQWLSARCAVSPACASAANKAVVEIHAASRLCHELERSAVRCWLVLASSAKLQNLISAAADQRRRKITLGAKYRRLRPHIGLGDSVSTWHGSVT